MRNISNEARLVMNKRRNFVNYAHVTLHDGQELYLKPSDFRISGNTITDDWNEGESFQLGSAIGKTATLLLDNTDGRVETVGSTEVVYPHGKFSEYDFYMAFFELYIHLPKCIHDGTELIDQNIPIGTFTVTTPASHGATIEITGVDNMCMFDRPFDECTLDFSSHPDLYTVLVRCCHDCGVAIGFDNTFLNHDLPVNTKPAGITYREVVSYIAQLSGNNAVISVSGALTLKYYDMTALNVLDGGHFRPWDGTEDFVDGGSFNPWTTGDIIDGGNFTDPIGYHNLTATNGTTISTDDIKFTGIMVSYSVDDGGSSKTESVHYPDVPDWDTYAMQIVDNPFVWDGYVTRSGTNIFIPDVVATSLWDILSGLEFRVFSCSSIQDPTIEAGDNAVVYDVKGNMYRTIITNVKFTTGGMTEVSCNAESPVKQNSRYVNPAAKAVAKAKENMDSYNAQVAHFNEIANQALGYYETKVIDPETHETITYRHDQLLLEDSTYIIKMTGTVIAISDDGGDSYSSGVDITTATMLMNLIYVHGLVADWITTGTLTVGGNGNKDGEIMVLNNSDNEIGRWDNSGISIKSGSIKLTKETLIDNKNGLYLGTDGIALGASSKFKVTNAGAVSASDMSITGGSIKLTKQSLYDNHTGLYLGSDGIALGSGYAFYVNNSGAVVVNGVDGDDSRFGLYGGCFVHMRASAPTDSSDAYITDIGPEDMNCYYYDGGTWHWTGATKVWKVVVGATVSDIRIKKDIKELDIELSKKIILGTKPKSFRFKENDSRLQFGVIAQETKEVIEDAGIKEPTALVLDSENDMWSVEYHQFIPHLINVVQEQQAEINDLKQRLERLESIVNTEQ